MATEKGINYYDNAFDNGLHLCAIKLLRVSSSNQNHPI